MQSRRACLRVNLPCRFLEADWCQCAGNHCNEQKSWRGSAAGEVQTGFILQYRIRLNDIRKINIDEKITVDGIERTYSYVELGNPGLPHVVMEIPGLSTMDKEELRHLGKELRYNKKFPKGANVNFYEITGRDTLTRIVYHNQKRFQKRQCEGYFSYRTYKHRCGRCRYGRRTFTLELLIFIPESVG